MGAIFPMAPLNVRLGFVRRREKEAKRAAATQCKAASTTRSETRQLFKAPATPSDGGAP
jgi:hypothetical protein